MEYDSSSDSKEYRLYQERAAEDKRTLEEMNSRVYDMIQTLNLPKNTTIGMYFVDNVGYVKHTVKSGYTLIGRVRFKNTEEYPCIIDAKKMKEEIKEDDDYAVVDLTGKDEELSVVYGMNIPSKEEINLFSVSLFPVTFEIDSKTLKEAVSNGETTHLSKNISIAKFTIKNNNLEIKTMKGRNILKKTNILLDKLSAPLGEKFEASVSSGLMESIIWGDQTVVRLHQGVATVENKFDGKLVNFDFVIYKNQIQEI